MWKAEDFLRIKRSLEKSFGNRYQIYPNFDDLNLMRLYLEQTGLLSIVDSERATNCIDSFDPYRDSSGMIRSTAEKVAGFVRGALALSCSFGSFEILHLNTHLTPVLGYSSVRASGQPRRIAQVKALTEYIKRAALTADFVIIGGDFNTSPIFKSAICTASC